VDLCTEEIALARAAADAIPVTNARFERADFRDRTIDSRLDAEYDYVLAHGVYSWTTGDARARLLELARDRMAPESLLFLSYNVHPGWKLRGVVRSVLLGLGSADPDSGDPDRAREWARRLRRALGRPGHPSAELLAAELDRVSVATDRYLQGEYLAPHNEAFYVGDVIDRAAAAGLTYVTDARADHAEGRLPEPLATTLREEGLAEPLVEETADLLAFRRFRCSLFRRSDWIPSGGRTDLWTRLHVAGLLQPVAGTAQFVDADGGAYDFEDPVARALLTALADRSPRGWPTEELRAHLQRELGAESNGTTLDNWPGTLTALHRHGLLELRAREPAPPISVLREPHALARVEAALRFHLTTPFHGLFRIEESMRADLAAGVPFPEDAGAVHTIGLTKT
jgi:hypothetical protein